MTPPLLTRLEPAFPLGMTYLDSISGHPGRISEPGGPDRPGFCERHLQAIWTDPCLRPHPLISTCGQTVQVVHPGRWNLQAGPDFLDARLQVGSEAQLLQGDVEIDVHPSGWHLHGHNTNPDFKNVAVHVTWDDHGRSRPAGLPETVLCIALRSQMKARENFSFAQIDVSAYPYEVAASESRPAAILQPWSIELKQRLLEAAGQARLLKKVERLHRLYAKQPLHEQLYSEICTTLGYRNNRSPFRTLANRLPWSRLRTLGSSPQEFAAVLLGQAGLLPDPSTNPDPDIRAWLRQCWHHWWQVQGELDQEPMLSTQWSLRSLRPVNHPRRRIVALAALCAENPDFFNQLEQHLGQDPASALNLCETALGRLSDSFWDYRLSLNQPAGDQAVALLGTNRIHQLYNNAVIPAALSVHSDPDRISSWAHALVPEPHHQITREALHFFFGPDAPRSLGKSTLRKMGLIQLFEDWHLEQDGSRTEDARWAKLETWLRAVREKEGLTG